jgi:stage II sporulation protein AA (anti-sigma F factor antagonist)
MKNPNESNLFIKQEDQKKNDCLLVVFDGDLDKLGLDSVRTEIDDLVEKLERKYLVFDFSKLNFINSESIGYLSTIYYRLVKMEKVFVVIGASAHVLDVLNVIGITTFIKVYNNYSDFEKDLKPKS